jgi:chromosome transmission fidelity protein 1
MERSRLKAKNLLYIKQIMFILSRLIKCVDGKTDIPGDNQSTTKVETKLITVNTFLASAVGSLVFLST